MVVKREQTTQSKSSSGGGGGGGGRPLMRLLAESTLVALAVLSLFGGSPDMAIIKRTLSNVLVETEILLEDSSSINQTTTTTTTTTSTTEAAAFGVHNPQRFTHNLQLNIDRGLNIVNCWTGQTIACWIYHGEEKVDDKFITWKNEAREKLLMNPQLDAPRIQANDTIFVTIKKLSEFTKDFLPSIQQDFVLITETWHIPYPDWLHELSDDIVNHPHLLQWFSNNIANYTGGKQYHPKVSPFPIGLKPNMPGAIRGSYRAPISTFRKIFLETLRLNDDDNDNDDNNTTTITNKTEHIFVGFLRDTIGSRRGMPRSGQNLDYPDYLKALAKAQYVISPNGDHPDCHRHYESLGMGAIPITEMDPFLYRHLAGGPVIFNNTNWNLTTLRANLPDPTTIHVNKNLVFEEYWMEHVEQVVGRPLRWWDLVQQKKSFLDDFATEAPSKLKATARRRN